MKKYIHLALPILLLPLLAFFNKDQITIFMVGDSTVANKPYLPENPEKGWGQVFGLYFTDAVKVDNHAVNGRSTKSFIDEGRWKVVLDKIQPGDYVIIEFGHNDQKKHDTTRYAEADTDYRNYLKQYVNETRDKGGIPVLATPIVRRRFDENGKFYDTHGRYPDVVREVAAEMDVPLLDMHKQTRQLLIDYGVERSKSLFLHIPKGEYASLPEGRADNTHLSANGAFRLCDLAVREMKTVLPELYKYLKTN